MWIILKYERSGKPGTPEFRELGIAIFQPGLLGVRWNITGPEINFALSNPMDLQTLIGNDIVHGIGTRAEVYRRLCLMGVIDNRTFDAMTKDDETIPDCIYSGWVYAGSSEAAAKLWDGEPKE